MSSDVLNSRIARFVQGRPAFTPPAPAAPPDEDTGKAKRAPDGIARLLGVTAADWEDGLLKMFVRNQLRVATVLPLLALLFTVAGSAWTNPHLLFVWLIAVLLAQGLQLFICRAHETGRALTRRHEEWIGLLAASELLLAAAWAMPLFLFWLPGNAPQHMFIVAVLMAVAAMRVMIAASFVPIVLAGSATLTMAVVLRNLAEADQLHVLLAAIALVVGAFFIVLSRHLQRTARDMLVYKNHRERLIRELERQRDEAEEAHRRAQAASEAKSRFLATMSHELRTPLNAVLGFSEIIADEMLGPLGQPKYGEYARDIHHSGQYLLALIEDILDISRIEAGEAQLRMEEVDIGQEAERALKLAEHRARDKGIEIIADECAPGVRVLADSRAVRQIWLNLMVNAIKFTEPGGRVSLHVTKLDDGGVEMAVADTGCGIAADELATITSAFTRGRQAREKAIDGAGLGLAIVAGLARHMEAALDIESVPGEGTIVSVTFPPQRVLTRMAAPQDTADIDAASATQKRLIALTA